MIRQAQIKDLEQILKLIAKVKPTMKKGIWSDDYPNKEIISNDIENNYAYVYLIDNIIVGYIVSIFNYKLDNEHIYKNHNNYYFITRVMVDKTYSNKGIASNMFNHIFKKSALSFRINVSILNDKAINLYTKLGFNILYEVDSTFLCEKII